MLFEGGTCLTLASRHIDRNPKAAYGRARIPIAWLTKYLNKNVVANFLDLFPVIHAWGISVPRYDLASMYSNHFKS